MMDAKALETLLSQNLHNAEVTVHSEDGTHFEALIVSPEFEGQSLLARQKSVYAALGDLISSGKVHALALKTRTPAEMSATQ